MFVLLAFNPNHDNIRFCNVDFLSLLASSFRKLSSRRLIAPKLLPLIPWRAFPRQDGGRESPSPSVVLAHAGTRPPSSHSLAKCHSKPSAAEPRNPVRAVTDPLSSSIPRRGVPSWAPLHNRCPRACGNPSLPPHVIPNPAQQSRGISSPSRFPHSHPLIAQIRPPLLPYPHEESTTQLPTSPEPARYSRGVENPPLLPEYYAPTCTGLFSPSPYETSYHKHHQSRDKKTKRVPKTPQSTPEPPNFQPYSIP